ncbi:MAG: SUF system Fe-S cluster assembly protein [Bacteroidales bacterium]|nr:SUF system Fe-S cluster assembly protein [Bacteroidales bacterium]
MSEIAQEPVTVESLEKRVIEALRQVYDPEIPVNIYDLGLIYKIEIDEDLSVRIVMTLTTPNCPEVESLPEEVMTLIQGLRGVKQVEVNLTFDPPWSQDNLSEEARLELGLL